MPQIYYSKSPLDGSQVEQWSVDEGANLLAWLKDNGFYELMHEQPLLVIINGMELMEDQYDRMLTANDRVAICAQQEGFDPITIFYLVVTVISVALYLTAPTPQNPNNTDSDKGSPTYSISSRGNTARLDQPKPVLYGTMRVYPDLSSQPYNEFDANGDQYVYQLFEVSQGSIQTDVSTWRFEDTQLTAFDNFEYEIIAPGSESKLFPSVVDVSDEVSNAELESSILGPYAANEPATTTERIALDVVLPQGLYYSNDDGGLSNHKVRFKFEYREIDDGGSPVGSWVSFGNEKLSAASRDPIRRTYEYTVPEGRYEVRMQRVSSVETSVRYAEKIQWSQMRAYISDTNLTTTTRIALKIRASNQVGNRALTKFNIIATRLIPKWNSTTGWGGNEATANPLWAYADACRQNYGGNRSDAYIDLPKIEQYAPILDSEGVEFNGVFDTRSSLWEGLTAILQPARCQQVDNRGVYTFVRDDQQSVPVQMFTMRNIVKDSFRIEHAGVLEETSDSIRAKFYDEDQDYRETWFLAALQGSTTNNPREVSLFGITNKDQAFKIAQWLNAQNFYRRERIKFETGIEGRIPFFGDLIAINHYMTGVEEGTPSISGEIRSFDGVDVLSLTEPVAGLVSPYIVIRDLEGAPTEPLTMQILDDYRVRVTDPGFDPSIIQIERGYERPQFAAGDGTDFMVFAKVEKLTVAGPGRIGIECYVDSPEVYTAADGLPVPPITQLPPLGSIVPVVSNLVYEIGGTVDNPSVLLTWKGDKADYYEVEYSIDAGLNYFPAGDGRANSPSFEHTPDLQGDIIYRVAGVSILRGAWESVAVDTSATGPGFVLPGNPTNLALRETFVGPVLKTQWDSPTYRNRVEYWRGGILRLARTVNGSQDDLRYDDAQEAGLQRAFDVRVYALTDGGTLSNGYAEISVSNPAPAQLNNLAVTSIIDQAAVTFDFPTDTDLAGISVWASDTSGFSPSNANLVIDRSLDPILAVSLDSVQYIRVAAVDVWGNTGINYSGEFTAEGGEITETQIADDSISTPKLKANAVTAAKILVSQLDAITANMGTLTAGTVKTTSGTSYRVEMSSAGDYPLWIGNGAKTEANALLYIDKNTGHLVYRGDLNVKSATSGARMEITNDVIKVFDDAGVKRVQIGNLLA